MESLTPLLEKIAEQLGTTVEYLWAVLIKQAAVSATMSIIYIVGLVVVGLGLYRAHRKLMRVIQGKTHTTYYDEYGEAAAVPMVLAATLWLILVMFAVGFSIPNAITGLFNPEYWALKEILSQIK